MSHDYIVFTVASLRWFAEFSVPGDANVTKENAPTKITNWVRENLDELPLVAGRKEETLAVAIKQIGTEAQKPPINFFVIVKKEEAEPRKATPN